VSWSAVAVALSVSALQAKIAAFLKVSPHKGDTFATARLSPSPKSEGGVSGCPALNRSTTTHLPTVATGLKPGREHPSSFSLKVRWWPRPHPPLLAQWSPLSRGEGWGCASWPLPFGEGGA